MSSNTPRFIIGEPVTDQQGLKAAFREVLGVCTQHGIGKLTLVVPSKKILTNTIIGQFLGDNATKKLLNKEVINIEDGPQLNLESINTFNTYSEYGAIVGIHLSAKNLDRIGFVQSAEAIIYLPWLEDEGKAWLETWKATVLGESNWQATRSPLNDEIADALERITSSINLSTGLSHPCDKDHAKRIFQDLRSQGLHADREDIRGWALRRGWHPKSAQELATLSERYL